MGKYLTTVRPVIDREPNQAFAADDILFDWTAFDIPKGSAKLSSYNIIVPGTDGTAANGGLDMVLLFAKSIDSVAPTTLGTTNGAMTVIASTAVKPNIISSLFIDGSVLENSGDGTVGYNILNSAARGYFTTPILEGEPNQKDVTEGYQRIYMAGIAQGAYDFGTGCLLDGAISSGSAGAQTLDVSEDTDADDVLSVGDECLAVASGGGSVQKIGTITALTADTITVDAKDIDGTVVWESGALADDDEIVNRRTIVFNLGFEY